MGLGGFDCSKNALAALNVLYILVSFVLIGTAAYGRASSIITSLTIMGGIIACGVFLLIIAFVGLIGAVKHHQVLLFFYMIILFILFIVQFVVACFCLAMNEGHQEKLARAGWQKAHNGLRQEAQLRFNCCGFQDPELPPEHPSGLGHPACDALDCCTNKNAGCCNSSEGTNSTSTEVCPCHTTCWSEFRQYMNQALKISGGIGLFFSFTEILGVWLTVKYRNQKDPRANPSAFL